MVDVTSFLTRWLYMCNLVRDVADIQTLPYTPLHPLHVPMNTHATTPLSPPVQLLPSTSIASIASAAAATSVTTDRPFQPLQQQQQQYHADDEWKDQCIRGILSYPPGTQRLYAMDALRLELVQKLAHHLRTSDGILQSYASQCRRRHHDEVGHSIGTNNHHGPGENDSNDDENDNDDDEDEDPYLDADVEIVRAFEQATMISEDEDDDDEKSLEEKQQPSKGDAVLVISQNGTDLIGSPSTEKSSYSQDPVVEDEHVPTMQEVEAAHRAIVDLRDYVPQLVSAVLKSPPAFQPHLLDPIQKLRRLILTRCLQDANWGIELCWLLEADVGRAWKTLFEHRQQTGKRLIVVLPAEKAAVLAKIGTEKREAFDLLQDAEQATAYGYTIPTIYGPSGPHYGQPTSVDPDLEPTPARLPSSLSLRRCSHFGDAMHFIDRLTQISLDLRMVPNLQRHTYLEESLCEMNRRLRRRMVTRGDVSLDVEDNRGPHEWPQLSDVSADMLKYSIHFPMEPKRVTWPGGEDDATTIGTVADQTKAGVMRVLNIVTSECRILTSRERCPYLVHLEVAETGLEGSDARLYASGARGLGATVQESLGMGTGATAAMHSTRVHHHESGLPSYHIPSELLAMPIEDNRSTDPKETKIDHAEAKGIDSSDGIANPQSGEENFPRGGWQSDENVYYPPESPEYLYSNPYDVVRQHEYEQLHQQMQMQAQPIYPPPQPTLERPTVTTKSALLEKVYGMPWGMKCNQIKQTSPYGKVKGWRLASFIMKAGEDIRREALVMQIISKMNEWFRTEIPEAQRPHMRPYTIMCVGGDAGLLECLSDAKSIDEVKKRTDGFVSLRDYFERAYGPPKPPKRATDLLRPEQKHPYGAPLPPPQFPPETAGLTFEQAQDNFLRSLVGYSLVCYVLQIKDRHNANILLDRDGHIMHIDFGFVLGDTPKMGKVPIFSERAPFKLSAEFWEVLGGWNFNEGGLGVKFCKMFEVAFACAAAHTDEIVSLVEAAMLNLSRNPTTARSLANGVRSRLRMRGPIDSVEQKTFIMDLVNTALTSWGTSTYDWLQKNMNGYQ